MKEARAGRCPLIVSRLERLSRNVHFITGLMEHKVHFVVAALGRDCANAALLRSEIIFLSCSASEA